MINLGKVHFIGIGGVSMRALAKYSTAFSDRVTGSDRCYNECFAKLRESGIEVWQGSNTDKIKDADLVVYSSAVPQEDKELAYAISHGIKCIERFCFLELMTKTCNKTIAISGSHGKTTVSALLTHIFKECGAGFVGHFGGEDMNGDNLTVTGHDYFVTEACEYRQSFLHLNPDIGVILNVDYDHPDCYKSRDELIEAFKEFADKSKVCITCGKTPIRGDITFGFDSDDTYSVTDISDYEGKYSFNVNYAGKFVKLTSSLYGRHNILNIAVAFAVAREAGLDENEIIKSIGTFKGVRRRFESKGVCQSGAHVISDYAHHPREIASVIDTAREIAKGKIFVIFEPHTYSRTKYLFDEFLKCFYWCDDLILLPTYSARECESMGMTSFELYHEMRKMGQCVMYMDSYDEVTDYINRFTNSRDTVLVLGAGTVDGVANLLVGSNLIKGDSEV